MDDLVIFKATTDGASWVVTCQFNEAFSLAFTTQESADIMVDALNRAFMIGLSTSTGIIQSNVNTMSAQLWPSPPENDEITPPDDVLENIIEDIEEAKNVDTEPVSEPK
tara:strand:+ start:1994 stop:2320 length:327 start_codon:yes stop_codon:yes gene_type:complete